MPLSDRLLFDIWNDNGWPDREAFADLDEEDLVKWKRAAQTLRIREHNVRKETLVDSDPRGWLDLTLRRLTQSELESLIPAVGREIDRRKP